MGLEQRSEHVVAEVFAGADVLSGHEQIAARGGTFFFSEGSALVEGGVAQQGNAPGQMSHQAGFAHAVGGVITGDAFRHLALQMDLGQHSRHGFAEK